MRLNTPHAFAAALLAVHVTLLTACLGGGGGGASCDVDGDCPDGFTCDLNANRDNGGEEGGEDTPSTRAGICTRGASSNSASNATTTTPFGDGVTYRPPEGDNPGPPTDPTELSDCDEATWIPICSADRKGWRWEAFGDGASTCLDQAYDHWCGPHGFRCVEGEEDSVFGVAPAIGCRFEVPELGFDGRPAGTLEGDRVTYCYPCGACVETGPDGERVEGEEIRCCSSWPAEIPLPDFCSGGATPRWLETDSGGQRSCEDASNVCFADGCNVEAPQDDLCLGGGGGSCDGGDRCATGVGGDDGDGYFAAPTIGGIPVDACAGPNADCSAAGMRAAADAFCRFAGYGGALSHDNNAMGGAGTVYLNASCEVNSCCAQCNNHMIDVQCAP